MQNYTFILNDQELEVSLLPGRTVLDYLRKDQGLFGTKEGCREGECGACTVILGRMPQLLYRAMPSCLMSVGQLDRTHLVTIEGLDLGRANQLQRHFIEEGASQCGFCTPGFILSLTGYLMAGRQVSLEGAMDAIDGNICRCTGYVSIRRAVETAIEPLLGRVPTIDELVELEFLPPYFTSIPDRLKGLGAGKGTDLETDSVLQAGGDFGPILAGGTDLYVRFGDEMSRQDLRFLIPESGAISRVDGELDIPATATIEQLRMDPVLNTMFPGIDGKLLSVASHILRNRATVAGNLVNGSPIADSALMFLAWDADLILLAPNGKTRRLSLRKFYLGYKQVDLLAGEMILSLRLRNPDSARNWNFSKVSKRQRLDIASCNSAVQFSLSDGLLQDTGLAVGGVAPVPYTAIQTMAYLNGRPASAKTFLAAFSVLQGEIAPIDDVRGSAEYKRGLASAQLAEHFLTCFPTLCSYDDFVRGGVL